jgi:DNA helicase-2/ATP-dependent DNA helicase PcrA
MKSFTSEYNRLNPAQRQAVDAIDGPVMVVAGPGTGKTQLLSMRVANILQKTDTLPSNILCLTFTESGATAMRQRLVSLMGQEGYKIAIHTFHSFGTDIINHNPEYFYQGANFRPADELSSFEVLEPLFRQLPHNDPLAKTMNGEFTALRDTQAAIGHLKKAGLTPDELTALLDYNELFLDKAEPIVATVFDVPRLGKKDFANVRQALNQLTAVPPDPSPIGLFRSIATICTHELLQALEAAEASNSTKPLTAWRNRWLERDANKKYIFKDRARHKKLRSVATIYQKYLLAMQEHELFDFDDMILRVVQALQIFPELRYNLQEQFLYVLVDEFQDTNVAQLRLLQNLLDSEVSNGRPNIMVVGDDDQAIYAFQGAEIGNILQFRELYREPTIITLTDNYRSTETILTSARGVITQGEYRLETTLDHINKQLSAHNRHSQTASDLHQFANPTQQYIWVIDHIKKLIKQGAQPNEIALLARNHRQLVEVLPFLRHAELAVNYERRNNILEAEHIQALILLARIVDALTKQRFDIADALLPQLLSYPFWGIDTTELWRLSLQAHKARRFWLELMLERDDKLRAIAELLVVASQFAHHQPLEVMLDMLIGSTEHQAPNDDSTDPNGNNGNGVVESFTSPLRAYYFNAGKLEENPAHYLILLSNLAVLRRKLREYRPDQQLLLADFVAFIDLHEKTGLTIVDTAEQHEDTQAINLMTAHKAKGLEFDAVFILSCQESIWGPSARTRVSSIRFPHNMPLEPAGQTADDCLRLFYVAMTRARSQLYLCSYKTDDAGKDSMVASFLPTELYKPIQHAAEKSSTVLAAQEPMWQTRVLSSKINKHELLQPRLQTYQLSSTHLNNFIDITGGGPQAFLLHNLLRFPQATNRNATFGAVIHAVLQRAHVHLTHTGERRPTEDILHDFELHLQNARLSEQDFMHLFEKGSEALQTFLTQRHASFTPTQKAEYSLRSVMVGQARLTGTLDLLEMSDDGTITVIDYKTGKAPSSWQGSSDFEKIKLHKYRQQLMMYKLLIENSPDFGGKYTVTRGILEFVEPNQQGDIERLELFFDEAELQQLTQLIQAVWQRIISLDLPDINDFSANYKGILDFEQFLIDTYSAE